MTTTIYDRLPYTSAEALWLIDGGVPVEEACHRVGIKPLTLQRALYRAGEPRDLGDAVTAQRRDAA